MLKGKKSRRQLIVPRLEQRRPILGSHEALAVEVGDSIFSIARAFELDETEAWRRSLVGEGPRCCRHQPVITRQSTIRP